MTSETPRLLTLLDQFAGSRALSVADLAAATQIPASAVYRQLAHLLAAGFVVAAPEKGKYCAGAKTLLLGQNFRHQSLARTPIARTLRYLSEDTAELAAYLVMSGSNALCVEAVEGPALLRCSYAPGQAQPLSRGASALTLLAFAAPGERDRVLAALHLDAHAEAEMREHLQRVYERGYGVTDSAVDQGVWGVACPIFDEAGALQGVVSTMAPSIRARARSRHYIQRTLAAAAQLTHQPGTAA